MGKIQYTDHMSDFRDCSVVIEAIVEDIELKRIAFKGVEAMVSPDTIIGSNTSSLSVSAMGAQLKHPERIIGIHFFNPAPLMRLVESIPALQTDSSIIERARKLIDGWCETTVIAKDTPGFIVNRILCPMINEAIYLLQEGVNPEDIDAAMKLGTNQPMGPLTLADFFGFDTLLYILKLFHNELGEDKYRPCPLLIKYVEAGWYGKKSGRGFYSY